LTASFDKLQQTLRRLPGLGYRSAERIALHLVVENPAQCKELVAALNEAAANITRCVTCGNICEVPESVGGKPVCEICADASRDEHTVCVVETVPDLIAIEKSGAYRGVYHVLHGRLSPVKSIGPTELNMQTLGDRVRSGDIAELILALGNDIESEATCHFIREQIVGAREIKISRIGFGLPSGSGIGYADSTTLKSALESRRGI
jgi:recombination protein RecR